MAESVVKKQNSTELAATQNTEKDFLWMNDDCLLKVFDFLELKDLCAISKTCLRLQVLAKRHFKCKFSSKWMRLKEMDEPANRFNPRDINCMFSARQSTQLFEAGMEEQSIQMAQKRLVKMCVEDKYDFLRWEEKLSKNLEYSPRQNYVMCFHECIRSVAFEANSQENATQFLEFLSTKHLEYNQIQFEYTEFDKKAMFTKGALNILANVQTIIFLEIDSNVDLYEQLLKHCKCLKKLVFEPIWQSHYSEQWMLHKYPTLEYVQIHSMYSGDRRHPPAYEKLAQFLQQNSQIKTLVWYFDYQINFDEIITTMDIIVKYGTALENLYLSFFGIKVDVDLKVICAKLEPLCNRSSFSRIELDFGHYESHYFLNTESLAALKKLTGLHQLPTSLVPLLDNLKTLQLGHDDEQVAQIQTHNISSLARLPNLEYLVWQLKYTMQPIDVEVCITPFVRHSRNLKTIVMNTHSVTDQKNEIMEWNRIRKDCGSKLTIYFETYVFQSLIQLLFIGINGEDVVSAKAINIVENIFNVESPFIQMSYEEV